MIITCGQCLAKFKVAPEQIKETGSKVRCSNCRHVFTVYRPGFEPDGRSALFYQPDETRLPEESDSPGKPGLGDYDDQSEGDELFQDDDGYDDQDYEEDQDEASGEDFYSAKYSAHDRYTAPTDDEALSLKERRDRRRQLYSDMEEESELQDEAEDDLYYDEDDLVGEDGRPPLRRASFRAAQAKAGPEEQEDGEEYDDEDAYEEYDEEEYEEYDDSAYEDDDYEVPARGGRRASLGLAADPVENVAGFIDDADYRSPGQGLNPDGTVIRAAVTKVSSRPPMMLVVILGVVIITLALGAVMYFTGRSAPTALSSGAGGGAEADGSGQGLIENDNRDSAGTDHITFTRDSQNYYLRPNKEAGQILIITGMVRNGYPEPRSYIRLRGHLLASDGTSLAERFIFAGNIISEEDLKNLPPSEILTRLSIKGGQDGRNMNIPPGAEIPFMIVFDKLPDGMAEYRVDPVGSSPAQ